MIFNKRYLFGGFALMFVAAVIMALTFSLKFQMVYLIGAAIVVLPVTIFTVLLARKGSQNDWQSVCLACGVPLGLLGAIIGFEVITLGAFNSPDGLSISIYQASSISLTTVLYGGIISAIGHFGVRTDEQHRTKVPMTLPRSILAIFLLVMTCIWVWTIAHDLTEHISLPALTIIGACVFSTFWLKGTATIKLAAEAAILSALVTLIIGTMGWYASDGKSLSAMKIMMSGMTYGLILYLALYFLSLTRDARDFIDVRRANWHWLEISAFLIFMFYAPATIRESISESQTDRLESEESALLESKLKEFEERILKLENRP